MKRNIGWGLGRVLNKEFACLLLLEWGMSSSHNTSVRSPTKKLYWRAFLLVFIMTGVWPLDWTQVSGLSSLPRDRKVRLISGDPKLQPSHQMVFPAWPSWNYLETHSELPHSPQLSGPARNNKDMPVTQEIARIQSFLRTKAKFFGFFFLFNFFFLSDSKKQDIAYCLGNRKSVKREIKSIHNPTWW